ncbi:MAG: hypothetical protein JWP91_371 [Fibrobacteres bacterium]|nr:hypothetical protein [Fibrobacterota bacterium]
MFTVEDYIAEWRKESLICINLFSKMPAGGLDYRPTPGQRNTVELLRYLSFGPYNGLAKIIAGDWQKGRPTAEVTAGMPPSDFPARMAWQMEAMAVDMRSIPVTSLSTEMMTMPWGETLKKGLALNYPYRWLVGYRMQLFLYLKSAGAHQLNTTDCWRLPAAPAAQP